MHRELLQNIIDEIEIEKRLANLENRTYLPSVDKINRVIPLVNNNNVQQVGELSKIIIKQWRNKTADKLAQEYINTKKDGNPILIKGRTTITKDFISECEGVNSALSRLDKKITENLHDNISQSLPQPEGRHIQDNIHQQSQGVNLKKVKERSR